MSAPALGREVELWAALAEASRLRVLDVLLDRGSATPTALAQQLPFTRQAVTKHLAVLARVGLVEGRRQGREVRYASRRRTQNCPWPFSRVPGLSSAMDTGRFLLASRLARPARRRGFCPACGLGLTGVPPAVRGLELATDGQRGPKVSRG